MKSNLFRKEALEKITSPDALNSYIKVISPRIWLFIAGFAIAVAGLVFFAVSTGYPVWDLLFGHTME